MGYVRHVLQPDEKLVYETRLSWAMYLPGLATLVLALIVFILLRGAWDGKLWWVSAVVAIAGVGLMAREWFFRWTTEIAITDRRIIFKRGFIRRDTIEMSLDKVESVDVRQSLFGRLLNYGDIVVRGTGSGFEPLRTIDNPLEFRSHITAV